MEAKFLQTPLSYVKGIGSERAKLMQSELGLQIVRDLVYFFPHRYVDKTKYHKIKELQNVSSEVQIVGKLTSVKTVGQNRGKRLVGTFIDDTGSMELVWFKFPQWFIDKLEVNQVYVIYGKVTRYQNMFNMAHPEMELLSEHKRQVGSGIHPVYPIPEKIVKRGVSNPLIRKTIASILAECFDDFEEVLSPNLISRLDLLTINKALQEIHFPQNQEAIKRARFRMKFEELFCAAAVITEKGYSEAENKRNAIWSGGYVFQ